MKLPFRHCAMPRATAVLALLVLYASHAAGFYLPGVSPNDYNEGDPIPLLVNHITPSQDATEDHKVYVYSYDYYDPRFGFCQPPNGTIKQAESLGSIIFGDRIFNSPFELKMLQNETCKQLCSSHYTKQQSVFVNRSIRRGYGHNWLIDGLPAARPMFDTRTQSEFYLNGFQLGTVDDSRVAHLYNHFEITVEYHTTKQQKHRVVGVVVEPFSWDRPADAKEPCAGSWDPVTLKADEETDVLFTYSVRFVPSATVWATRWDKYLHVYDPKIQWFSLVNFSIVVLLLSAILGNVLLRALRRDFVRYSDPDSLDDALQDDGGWKLVHGDVFRPPARPVLFSVLLGSGAQLFVMVLITTGFALLGFLSPSSRGSLATVMLLVLCVCSAVGGFASSVVYKFCRGERWKLVMILTPVLVPGIVFGIFLVLNFFLIGVESSGAVPFGTMVAIVLLWFLVSIPLSVVGSLAGWKLKLPEFPVRTNQIPRQVPPQPGYLALIPSMLLGGLFPFGAMAVELFFIVSSIWFNKVFYMFGFLFLAIVLVVLTTALVSVMMTYYALSAENYHWQWRSYFIAAGCGIYVFIHSMFLTGGRLGEFTSIVLYLGYSLVLSAMVALVCAFIGFTASAIFVYKIYGYLKID